MLNFWLYQHYLFCLSRLADTFFLNHCILCLNIAWSIHYIPKLMDIPSWTEWWPSQHQIIPTTINSINTALFSQAKARGIARTNRKIKICILQVKMFILQTIYFVLQIFLQLVRGDSVITSRSGAGWVYIFFVILRDGKLGGVVLD